jgi:hypothetical protein
MLYTLSGDAARMQAAIFNAGHAHSIDLVILPALLVPKQMQSGKNVAPSKLRDRPFPSQCYSVRKERETVFSFIPQANLIYNI